jgi:hypothetical protein
MLQAEQLAFRALTLIVVVGDTIVMGWLIAVLVDGLVINLTDLDASSQESNDKNRVRNSGSTVTSSQALDFIGPRIAQRRSP